MDRVRLFSERQEKINIYWPLVLSVAGFALVLSDFSWTQYQSLWFRFLTGVILLDTLHVAFTYFSIHKMPEFNLWVAEKARQEVVHPYIKWIGIYAFLVLGFYLAMTQIPWFTSEADGLFLIVLVVGPLFHGVLQYQGLSFLYNRACEAQIQLTPEEKQRLKAAEKRERTLFTLCLTVWIAQFLFFSSSFKALNGIESTTLFLSSMFFPLLIVINSLTYPHSRKSNKTFYLLRLLMKPLSVFFPVFNLSNKCIHGIEYMFVFNKMYARSEIKKSKVHAYQILGLFVVLALFLTASPAGGLRWLIPDHFSDNRAMIDLIGAVSLATTFHHFYMDRVIFKMSRKLNRDFIGPLVVDTTHRTERNEQPEFKKAE